MSARATHLKAATENVSVTTIERKQMSNKTNFKRIALAVVAALGFGVLASGPSIASIPSGSTLTAAAPTAAITAGDTATAVLTATFTSIGGAGNDSMSVTAIQTGGTATSVGAFRAPASADSSNVLAIVRSGNTAVWANAVTDKAASATFRFDFLSTASTAAGTYTYTFYPALTGAQSGVNPPAPVTFAITVAAANVKPAAAQSSAWLQGIGGFVAYTDDIRSDSAIVTDRGTGTNAVGTIVMQQRNSDSSTAVLTPESVTVVSSGVGLVGRNGGSAVGAFSAVFNDTITVYSDGRAGTQTITLSTTSMTSWKTFTITYSGTVAKAAITAPFSVMSASAPAATNTVRVTPRDSGDNLLTSSTNMWLHSSDTKVIANATASQQCAVAANATLGYGTCDITARIVDSGTAKIKFANFAFGTAAASMPTTQVVSNEIDITVVGSAASVKISFDKRTYTPGETAKITVSVLDGLGKGVANQTIVSLFAAGGITVAPAGTGTVSAETITTVAATHGQGNFVYTYTMPTSGIQVVASATGGTGLPAAGRVAVSDTVTIINLAEEAANSALDAAQEATDAAIAATDAAILAQEAADEAASAAVAAQETAQAAVDAVTALSAEVTKLVAQIATLQKLLNRVAKRVGVKR